MIHTRFILRQLIRFRVQSAVFVLCVALSMLTLVAIGSFSESVSRHILKDARALHGGDIILESWDPFSAALEKAVSAEISDGKATAVRVYGLYSVVRTESGERSLLCDLKVVDRRYPLYGEVGLLSGKMLGETLLPGRVVVDPAVLDRLALSVGDNLQIGEATLSIADVIESEPDRPVQSFSFGPRVLVAGGDLERLHLVATGSRVRYVFLLRFSEDTDLNAVSRRLQAAADPDRESVETFRTAGSRVKRFFDNFTFFLNLIAIFILMLAGVGIQSSLSAVLRENRDTVAIMKTLGAGGKTISINFHIIIVILGLLGISAGVTAGLYLQGVIALLFGNLLPEELQLLVSWNTVTEGIVLGVLVVVIFTYLPLQGLRTVKPAVILRKDAPSASRKSAYLVTVVLLLLFFGYIVFRHIGDIGIGLYFIGGVMGFLVLIWLGSLGALYLLKKAAPAEGRLVLRLAIKGLFRPGNASNSIVVTLSAALSIIFSIYLVEQNLDRAFMRSFPEDAPNIFFLDIQPDQAAAFSDALGTAPTFYPLIRARLVSVGGERIDRSRESKKKRGDHLARTFNLTYREHLLDDERIIEGGSLFDPTLGSLQVSVLDTVVGMRDMEIGDRLIFNIQGVPLEAVIASIRTRDKGSLSPFFYFVFPREALEKAPQTIFTALRVPEENINSIQSRMVSKFPNVSAIDVSGTLRIFGKVMKRLSGVVRFFAGFSIAAGILIIISAALATRFARIREAVYYRVLGARKGFVLRVFAVENILIGLVSGFMALAISQTAAWLLTTRIYELDYDPQWKISILLPVLGAVLVTVTGLMASASVLGKKPVIFLREQADE